MELTEKLTASQEDYLEIIWALVREQRVARVTDIAERLGVSMPSVTGALKTLAKLNLVEYSPHKFITLSEEGRRVAQNITSRHRILREFLTDVLDLPAEKAEQTACRIEHAIGDTVSQRLHDLVHFWETRFPRKDWPKTFRSFRRDTDNFKDHNNL